MIFFLVLIVTTPLIFFVWQKTSAYVAVKSPTAGWSRMAVVRTILAILACACAAQGTWEAWHSSSDNSSGVPPATLFVVDSSASMLVMDVPDNTSRLNFALNLAQNWAEKNPTAPVGLVEFGASPRTITPRTVGPNALAEGIAQIRANTPLVGPEFIPGAILEAIKRAGQQGQVVVLSDGGDTQDGPISTLGISTALQKMKTRLVMIPVGTKAGGRIPLRQDIFGETQYKMFQGTEVIAQSTPQRLENFAYAVGGKILSPSQMLALSAPGIPTVPSEIFWAIIALVCGVATVALPTLRRKKTSV